MAIFETSNFGDFGVFCGYLGVLTMTFVQELYILIAIWKEPVIAMQAFATPSGDACRRSRDAHYG